MLSTISLQAVLALTAGAGVLLSKKVYPQLSISQQHFEALAQRASTKVNPEAVTDVECIDPDVTVGESESARFSLNAASEGATITVSKGRWEQCVRATRAVCPTGSMAATCAGGASRGDMEFVLDSPESSSKA
ncbi:hypothetical protein DL767_002489 [Monosporascus sp. MG133]|nr:hypothetical protein DL767_002489 [Monosporascus sp. MG133]